jgi:cyanuric acid amidohydrolase
MARRAYVTRLAARSPDDIAVIQNAIDSGEIEPNSIVTILGKTEGNGCVNDFTRAFAVRALRDLLAAHVGRSKAEQIAMVMSGGTEGCLSPHWIVFEARETNEAPRGMALALGVARTPELPFEHLGRRGQVQMVAEAVRAAMQDAGIKDPKNCHYVQVKCPLLTSERIQEVALRNKTVSVQDTLKSMSVSRAASALGVALALEESSLDTIHDDMIGIDLGVYSNRAGSSAGVELNDHEIMVAGMSDEWSGPLAIDHTVMTDGIDIEPVRDALSRLGLATAGQLVGKDRTRIHAVLAKAEASQSGQIRNNRHIMLDDSDISSTRHARSYVGGALAGLFGFTDLFVSGGAEHQGPDGGGPVAIIVSR